MMKKIVLSLSLLLFVAASFAQEQDRWNGLPRHELSLGVGDCLMPNWLYSGYQTHHLCCCVYDPVDFDEILCTPTYHNDYYSTPVVSVGYLYRVTKFLWLGANVNWVGVYGKIFDASTELPICSYSENQFALLPTIRFSYLNKKYVTLYSGLSTGLFLSSVKNDTGHSMKVGFAGQLTLFGVSAGNNWFGYAELGVGYKGFVNAGFGYKFNSKK